MTITEFSAMLVLKGNQVPIPESPGIRTQILDVGDSSQTSEPFSAGTKFIRVHTDEACAVAFGPKPVATPADARMSANSTELFAVQGGDKVAVIGLGNQAQGDGTFALLQVIADPKAAQARLAEINAATTANTKTLAEMKAAAELMNREKAHVAAREATLMQRAEALATERVTLDARAAQLAADRETLGARTVIAETESRRMSDFEAKLVARDTVLQGREKAIAIREQRAAAREDALAVSEAGYARRMAKLKELAGGAQ